MLTPPPLLGRIWQPAGFLQHVQSVLTELQGRPDRRLVLRLRLAIPENTSAADSSTFPRLAWQAPHGLQREALGVALACPLRELRWLDDAPHPDDLAILQTFLADASLLTNAVLCCGFPRLVQGQVVVPLDLWVPRLWLHKSPDGVAEVTIAVHGQGDAAELTNDIAELLARLQPSQAVLHPLVAPKLGKIPQSLKHVIQALQRSEAEKAVWSQEFPLQGEARRSALALALAQKRPEAHVVDVQLADGRNFLCATPEELVRLTPDRVKTMALAGTGSAAQLQHMEPRLDREHGLVERFLQQKLSDLGVTDLHRQTRVAPAGPLLHRQTLLEGQRPPGLDALTAVLTLHPTPALLGSPRLNALELLEKTETPRRLYGGTVALLACDGTGLGEAAVLLRGVEAHEGQWHLRVGAGLVAQSNVADEYAEIAAKMRAVADSVGGKVEPVGDPAAAAAGE